MTATDLLFKVFEYLYNARFIRRDTWPAELNKDNLPLYYRCLQLEAMFRAFDLKEGDQLIHVDSFTSGDFILLDEEKQKENCERVMDFNRKYRPEIPERENQVHVGYLGSIFSDLLRYRYCHFEINESCKSSWLEGKNIAGIYVLSIKSPANEKVKLAMERIDYELSLLIDPQQRNFSIQEMINTYQYPDVDLRKIDFDYYTKDM